MGLPAEMDNVAHPPAVERNGRPAADRAQRAALLSGELTRRKRSLRADAAGSFKGVGTTCYLEFSDGAPYRKSFRHKPGRTSRAKITGAARKHLDGSICNRPLLRGRICGNISLHPDRFDRFRTI
jgi:hypothetical protein